MMITYDDTNDRQKYVDNVLIADVWLNLAVTTVTYHSPGILVNKLVGIYFKGKITKTSWDCTGPSSAQTGTETYFIHHVLHKIDYTS